MKKAGIGLLLVFGMAISCQSPFFGDQLKSEHIEEEVYVPPRYDKVVPPLTVTATTDVLNQIDITWTKVASASGYRIYRSEAAETGFELLAEVTETAFADNGSLLPLKSGLPYYYKIASVNLEKIESTLTAAVIGRCYLENGEVIPPTVVNASFGNYADRIEVSWDAVPTAASYRVFRVDSEKAECTAETMIAQTEANVYSDTDDTLKQEGHYYYRIQSIGKTSQPDEAPAASALSVTAVGCLADPTVPTISGFKATTDREDAVLLTWNPVSCPVRLYRAESINGEYVFLHEVKAGGEYLDKKDYDGLREKVYFYRIQAIKSENEKGILSDPIEGSLEILPPQITLVGGDVIIDLNRNQSFEDPGYSVFDKFDGDLTSYCTVDDSGINYEKRGVWTVVYSVTDAGGQKATAERKVKTVFLPNVDNAEIVVGATYAVSGKLFPVQLRNLQPAVVPSELETSYSYEWSVSSGQTQGRGDSCTVLVNSQKTDVAEAQLSLKISTADGFATVTKTVTIYPDLSSISNTFSKTGSFGNYLADYKVRLRTAVSSWVVVQDSGLSADYSYLHGGGGDAETLLSVANGAFVINNVEVDSSNWAGVGDKADTMARLYSPQFFVSGGVKYKISLRVYRESGAKADVFVRLVAESSYKDVLTVSKTAGWTDYSLEYIPDSDNTVSLQVWKMPSGYKEWDIVNSKDILSQSCDSKEVRIDDLSIDYWN